MKTSELQKLIREEIQNVLNEAAPAALDLSDKRLALSIKDKLPAKYKKDTKTLVYNAPYSMVSHGAKLTNLPTPSRVYQLEKLKEASKGSDNWVSLSSLAIVQDTTNQVTFVIVYDEFDPIRFDEIKSNKNLYKEESYTDEKDLLKKMQNWFMYSEKVFKEVIEDTL
jgi:hypothetical protein